MDLSKLTKTKLLELCENNGFTFCKSKNKKQLVDLINSKKNIDNTANDNTANDNNNNDENIVIQQNIEVLDSSVKCIEEFVNKIINEDSATALKKIPANSVDLTVTSPPYDDIRDYKGYNFNDTATNGIIAEFILWRTSCRI